MISYTGPGPMKDPFLSIHYSVYPLANSMVQNVARSDSEINLNSYKMKSIDAKL